MKVIDMAKVPMPKEKWSGAVGSMALGDGSVSLGGVKGMPFLSFEDPQKHRPLLAGEVVDDISDFPSIVLEQFGTSAEDPVSWAMEWKSKGADLICLRLLSTDPERNDTAPEKAAEIAKKVADSTGLPLIVYGSGIAEKDAAVMEAVGKALEGHRSILAYVEEDSYKRMASTAVAHKHAVLAFSNLDIHLAKQMNILLSDFGVDRGDIVMDPLMAPLGMGLEYSYSVNERIMLAALSGDRMLQVPMVCDASQAWQVRDCSEEDDTLGDAAERAAWWEFATALAALLSGADVLIVRGAKAMDLIQEAVNDMGGHA